MQLKKLLKSNLHIWSIIGLTLGLTSCGSYQYVGYVNDGVYDDSFNDNVEYVEQSNTGVTSYEDDSSLYYQNYFKDKVDQYEVVANEEDIIFTDVDSYSSNYTDEDKNNQSSYNSYGGWGENNNQVTINYIDNGWNNWGWGGFYDPFWNSRWGWNNWGWNNWGWNNWGWNNWGWNNWNYGWGWNNWGWNNWGWNFGMGWGPYWSPWYVSPYNNGFYNRRGISYNATRRGSLLRNNSFVNRTSRNYNTSRRNSTFRNSNSRATTRYTLPRNSNSRTRYTSPRNSNSRTDTRSTRPRVNNNSNAPRRSSSSNRSISPSRSSSGTYSRGQSGGSRSSSGRSSSRRRN